MTKRELLIACFEGVAFAAMMAALILLMSFL